MYGFHTVQQRFGELVTAVGEPVINDLITQSMAEHSRQMDLFTRLFVQPGITQPTRTFRTPSVTRNQPLDEFGRPLPIRGEAKYTAGFPLQDSGNAFGWTWLESRKQRVEDVNRVTATIQDGDRSWVFDHILAALFNATNRTYHDIEAGDVTVMPIANGDTQVYQVPNGGFSGSTDNHQLAQAAAIADATNPFPIIYSELTEHPENGNGRVVAFIPSNLKADVQLLGTFYGPNNPDLTPGIGNTTLSGQLGVQVPGTVLGVDESGPWVVEWPRMPSNYIVAIATGGEPPIGERVDEDAALRGFIETEENADFPWYQRNFMRRVGYGAWNRLAAVVYRIGNASYAVPTNYATIMP